MESLFRHDFASVRIRQDGVADSFGARAVTLGEDIHISPAEDALSSLAGRSLIAHELTHVIQQRRLPGSEPQGESALEREADKAATLVGAAGSAKVRGRVAAADLTPQRKPRIAPPPPVGNILYVGMNNADPEIAALLGRYRPGSPVSVTVVKGTAEETATAIGGSTTYDLTTDAGMDALAAALVPDAAKRPSLAAIFKRAADGDRDDLAHVAKVYSDTESDGKDRMTRVVLSGHSGGSGVFGGAGEVYFQALVDLADVFPRAANQVKHLMVAGCHTGDEGTILDYYVKAYPSLLTVWAWWDVCPTGPGAAKAIEKWAGLTEHGETALRRQSGGIATWSGGTYQGSRSGEASVTIVLDSIQADDARFQEYFDGTRADPSPHGGWLEAYYIRVLAAAARPDVTGPDRVSMDIRRQRALRLRFWPDLTKNYWAKYGAVIAKGYGTGAVPNYASLSRKDALKAISDFPAVSTAAVPDKSAAAVLLDGLKNLDPALLPDSMIVRAGP
jgi:hypothetical protein